MLPVVILAGGLATRLYPVTQKIPKSMIMIDGRPFIDHQLELLKEKGISHVILCVGNFGKMIESYVGDGSRFGLDVQYSYDGNILLGTGGAVKKAARMLPDIFMIMYGDSYLDINYNQIVQQFIEGMQPALMTVYRNRNAFDTSNIIMKDAKILKYDKKSRDPSMEYIDFGLIVVQKRVFDRYPANEPFDLSLLLSRLVDEGQILGHEVPTRFFEIGSPSGIKETEEYIRKRRQVT
ncbi:MAG: NTP transferase domain-containing protein [Methanospirillum sp.]|uniref:sugar phosphate nucleotidyltransferase n=1 Tax=Methanospirillum sp. TaxID=45200 RepID=UPI00236EE422|nr:sugar phosphate nucleotidyltransferase [Methanospirillum sp.]MDD1729673.1 NTP transferase domain-containing protein [Methanospirillum sp.]